MPILTERPLYIVFPSESSLSRPRFWTQFTVRRDWIQMGIRYTGVFQSGWAFTGANQCANRIRSQEEWTTLGRWLTELHVYPLSRTEVRSLSAPTTSRSFVGRWKHMSKRIDEAPSIR